MKTTRTMAPATLRLPTACLALACALTAMVTETTTAGAQPFVNFESGHVRPLALSADGTRLFAVNTPDGRLAVYDVVGDGLSLVADVPVGMEPVAVAARSRDEAWVVNHLSDSVSIVQVDPVDPLRSRVVRTLHTCDEPRDIVFAGPGDARAFVTTARRGQSCPVAAQLTTEGVGRAVVQVFDANNLGGALGGTPIANIVLFGDTPRALARTADGSAVYAAVFHSGNRSTTINESAVSPNGGLPPPPPGALGGGPPTGLIVKQNPLSGNFEDEIGRNWTARVSFSLPDLDVFRIDANATPPVEVGSFAGVGTVLFNMAVNPANGKVYVSNTDARNHVRFEGIVPTALHGVRGHIAESRITVIDGPLVTPRHLNPHIDYSVVPGSPAEVEQSVAFPTALVFTSDGGRVFVAAFGSEKLATYATSDLESGLIAPELMEVGGGPSGLALDEGRDRLYVMTRIRNRIAVVSNASDAAARRETDSVGLRFDPETPEIRRGRRLLYDARRTSAHGDSACASCHVFGDFDSLAWDLGDASAVSTVANPNPFRVGSGSPFHPLKGPMTTQSLRGMANAGPMHWRGDRTGGTTGGDPLDEELAFKAFNPAFVGLLGRGSELPADEMQDFTDFILSVRYPPNPIRALSNTPTAAQSAGESFFLNTAVDASVLTCVFCHRMPFGTDGLSSIEGEPQEFKIAHQRNLYQKVGMFGFPGTGFLGDQVRGFGFLHDGSVDTIFTFLNAPAFNFGSGAAANTNRRNVEQFLFGFDTGLRPAVGQQVSATPTTFSDAGVIARIGLLVARDDAGDCELVVKGMLAGEARGWLHTSGGSFQSDRAADPLVSEATLRAQAATPGRELVYTCVPPGSGMRLGLDRDGDGHRDRDEIDAGADPGDARSTPGGLLVVAVRPTALTLKDDNSPPIVASRRRLTLRSMTKRDPQANRVTPPPFGSAGDPVLFGATLRVYNADGGSEQTTISLPAGFWLRTGSSGYRYRNPSADSPVFAVDVRADALKVVARGAAFGFTLDEPRQGRVGVRLALGDAVEWCTETAAKLSGRPRTTDRNDTRDKFVGRPKTAAPSFCTAPPLG
jgi:DNA-binding beta-propeller fold protein YncE